MNRESGERVFVGLGSNLGDRRATLRRALRALDAAGTRVLRISSAYRTAAVGEAAGGEFLNAVAEIRTTLPPRALLLRLKGIEWALGRRKKRAPRGPREVDLDLLLYGDRVVALTDLAVPHRALAGRPFVLAPLAEIDPSVREPVRGGTAAGMLAKTVRSEGDVIDDGQLD